MNKTLTSLTRVILLAMALPLVAAGSAKASKAKGSVPSHAINLNTASVTELMQLPKVGMKTAERIITFRKAHGGFRRSEELMNVKGIGEKSFVKLQPFLSVGAGSLNGSSNGSVTLAENPITVPVAKASRPTHSHRAAKSSVMK